MRLTAKYIRLIILLLGLIIIPSLQYIFAQDIHLSQFYTSPLNLNPASTGFYSGTHRFGINCKNQWNSITTPYQTMAVSAELHILKRKFHRDIFGGGIQINHDKAGDSEYGTFQSLFSFSYIKSLNKKNNHFISIGIQTGASQRKINYNALKFDNQFDGDAYNPALSHGEDFKKDNLWYFDFSSGLHWHLQLNNEQSYEAGASLFHINSPNQSFLGYDNILLDKKLILYGNAYLQFWDKTDLYPAFLYMNQGKYREFVFGSRVAFIKDRHPINYTATDFGLFIRHKDAVIVVLGIDYKSYTLGLSYDINISKLKTASNSRGGFEISVTYRLNKSDKIIPREVPCPIF